MGMVKTREIGRPACLPPKSVIAAHGGASETERMSIDDEDLASPSRFKIQSRPAGNSGSELMAHKTFT